MKFHSEGVSSGAIFKTKNLNDLGDKIIFANGGDRTWTNIPEMLTYGDDPNVEFKFGVGGENKKNSSSWILGEWKTPKTQRKWGWYRVLDHQPENNFTLQIGNGNVISKNTKKISLRDYEYIPRIKWSNDADILVVTTLNRHQNNLKFL